MYYGMRWIANTDCFDIIRAGVYRLDTFLVAQSVKHLGELEAH